MNMKKKEIIMTAYYRVSTKAETQLSSFHNQADYFRTLLSLPENKDYKAYERFYYDYGISGTGFLNRDGFNDMLKDAGLDVEIEKKATIAHPSIPGKYLKQNKYSVSVNPNKKPKFNYIWTKTTSRFARNINAYDILCTLRLAGVYVYFIDINLSTETREGLSAIRKKLDEDMSFSEQLSRGRAITQIQYEQKNRLNGCPYGYDYHPKTRTSEPYYTINPVEGVVVRKIFEYSIEGLGVTAISRRLEAEGHLKNGKRIGSSSVKKILDNEKYMGMNNPSKWTTGALFEKLSSVQVRKGYEQKLRPHEGLPAIITPETFYKAKESATMRRTPRVNAPCGVNTPKHNFKDILVCSHCGNHFIYDNNSGRGFYKCSTKRNHGITACNCVNVFNYQLEKLFSDLQTDLPQIIQNDFFFTINSLVTILEAYIEKYENPVIGDEEATKIADTLKSKQEMRDSLTDKLLSSTFSKSSFEKFSNTIDELEKDILILENQLEELVAGPEETLETITKLFEVIYEQFNILDHLQKTYTLEEVRENLSHIMVYGETVNSSGGRPPQPTLVPVLKSTDIANGLVEIGIKEFEYKFRNHIPTDYEPPVSFIQTKRNTIPIPEIHPIDDDTLSKAEQSEYYTNDTKSHWETGKSKYLLGVDSDFTPNYGVENEPVIDQLRAYTDQLHQRVFK